jgi:molecular chaperone DnaK
VDAAQVEKIKQYRDELQAAVTAKDIAKMNEKKEVLQKALHELSATIYNQTAEAGQATAEAPGADQSQAEYGPQNDGPTVDADYKVQDDK